jgi:hypothetical protein
MTSVGELIGFFIMRADELPLFSRVTIASQEPFGSNNGTQGSDFSFTMGGKTLDPVDLPLTVRAASSK